MTVVPSRELRNHTADVLRRIEAGERVTVTVNGKPVAELAPVRSHKRRTIGRTELAAALETAQADAGLRDDLAVLAGDTTEDLGPLR